MRCVPAGFLASLLLASVWVMPAHAVEVRAVRLWASPESTRVVLDLTGNTQHSLLVLKNPDRVVLDVSARLVRSALTAPAGAGAIKQVRMGRRPSGDLRVVFDLSRPIRAKSFIAAPNDQYGYRLVIDFGSTAQRRDARQSASMPAPKPAI